MKYKELFKKAADNDWTTQQLENALQEEGIKPSDLPAVEELDLEAMGAVSGGYDNDPSTCNHDGGWTIQKQARITGPGSNDWGYHVQMQKFYICKLCGKCFWEDQLPR